MNSVRDAGRRRRLTVWQRLGRAALAVALAVAAVVTAVGTAPPAGATVAQFQSATWNMNGAVNWPHAGALAQTNDVVALQEAGQPPNMGTALRSWTFTLGGTAYTVSEYRWQLGSSYRVPALYVYHLPTNATRNGLAIISHERADDVHLVFPQLWANGTTRANRPAFGIEIAGTGWWTYHAGAGRSNTAENDAEHMIDAIADLMADEHVDHWAILGDFNRNLLAEDAAGNGIDLLDQYLPAGVRIVRSNQPTRPSSGRELDYMVTNDTTVAMAAETDPMGGVSDHVAVGFGTNMMAMAILTQIILHGDTSRCLDVPSFPTGGGGGDVPGTRPRMAACDPTDLSQVWQLAHDYTVKNADGLCLDNSAGNLVQMSTCNGASSQQWKPLTNRQLVNGASGSCLDPTAPSNPPPPPPGAGGVGLTVSSCSASLQWDAPSPFVTVPPAQDSSTNATSGPLLLVNGRWQDKILCANDSNNNLYLRPSSSGVDPYCSWVPLGDRTKFILFNPAKNKVMAYEGGNANKLQMEPTAYPDPSNAQFFSWGGKEDWGANALQAFIDSGQNVNAADSGGNATAGAVRTGAWNGGRAEVTWNTAPSPANVTCLQPEEDSACVKPQGSRSYVNGNWISQQLCATSASAKLNPAGSATDCTWTPLGANYRKWIGGGIFGHWEQQDKFVLYNPEENELLAYDGGKGNAVVMEPASYPLPDAQNFSWGGQESWGAYALQVYADITQNVDAKDQGSDAPNTTTLHTRAWNTGHQRELTWISVAASIPKPPGRQHDTAGDVLIENAGQSGKVMCAAPDSAAVTVEPLTADIDPYCLWQQGGSDTAAYLYNPAKGMVLDVNSTATPAVATPLDLQPWNTPAQNREQWSWGSPSASGGRALRPLDNSGVGVSGLAQNGQTLVLGDPSSDAANTSWLTVPIASASYPPATAPTTSNQPPNLGGTELVQSLNFPGYVMCASSADTGVRLEALSQSIDPYCLWRQGGAYLYNPAKDLVLDIMLGTAPIPAGTAVGLQPYYTNPQQSYEWWNWGSGRTLRPVDDGSLSVSDKGPDGGPSTGQALTLVNSTAATWTTVPVVDATAGAVTHVTLQYGDDPTSYLCSHGAGAVLGGQATSIYCQWRQINEPGGAYALVNQGTGGWLTYQGDDLAPSVGAAVGGTSQWWTIGKTDPDALQTVQPYGAPNESLGCAGGVCVTDDGQGPDPSNTWTIAPVPTLAAANATTGSVNLFNQHTSQCADLPNYGANPAGTPVTQFGCVFAGWDNQQWRLKPTRTDGTVSLFTLVNVASGLCLDLPGTGAAAAGTAVDIATCAADPSTDNQEWYLVDATGGHDYEIVNYRDDLCLDVAGWAADGSDQASGAALTVAPGDDPSWANGGFDDHLWNLRAT